MIPVWLAPVATLINKLLDVIGRVIRVAKNKARQNRANNAAENPGRAFADHFGGRVRDVPEDASQADKTSSSD